MIFRSRVDGSGFHILNYIPTLIIIKQYSLLRLKNVDDEISKLQRDLEILKFTTSKKIESLESRINHLREGERTTERPPFATHHTHLAIHPVGSHRDRDGNIIYVGSVVTFLTKGRFDSTEGVVDKYNKTRVITVVPAIKNIKK